jgi:hypothetical protein
MITKEQAQGLAHGATVHFESLNVCARIIGPRGGIKERIVACRVSGRCQTWKTRPTEFRIPVKFGLYENGEITRGNAEAWHLADECRPVIVDLRPAEVRRASLEALVVERS